MTWDQGQVDSSIRSKNWTNFEQKVVVCAPLLNSRKKTYRNFETIVALH